MDVHFRLLRQDFVEPLREAVLGYRREQKDVSALNWFHRRSPGLPSPKDRAEGAAQRPEVGRRISVMCCEASPRRTRT